jgi:putative ABC transport system permease protein
MFGYYLGLAIRSLKRSVALTILMIIAIGVGIGASMTTLAVFRAMSGDPIPQRSRQLFVAQIDSWGPDKHPELSEDQLEEDITYRDAMALMSARAAKRQTAIYSAYLAVKPSNPQAKPFKNVVRAVYTDFFPMLNVPFKYGGPWSSLDDENRAAVVVITRQLNDRLFGGANSAGQSIHLGSDSYRVIGVIDDWQLMPRFYDLHHLPYGDMDEIFVPFSRAIEKQMSGAGGTSCKDGRPTGWEHLLQSECLWVQFWAELPTTAAVRKFRVFLDNYASQQQHVGRFHWASHTQIRDVVQWLRYRHVVPSEMPILVLVSFGFLFVCLLNAMGLMLAKIMGRAGDISVRRALGASRRAIFAQCLIETGLIGAAGGTVGLGLTALGLFVMRKLLSEDLIGLTRLDFRTTGVEILVAVAATAIAGLYPTLRAVQIEPAWQLKAQ